MQQQAGFRGALHRVRCFKTASHCNQFALKLVFVQLRFYGDRILRTVTGQEVTTRRRDALMM